MPGADDAIVVKVRAVLEAETGNLERKLKDLISELGRAGQLTPGAVHEIGQQYAARVGSQPEYQGDDLRVLADKRRAQKAAVRHVEQLARLAEKELELERETVPQRKKRLQQEAADAAKETVEKRRQAAEAKREVAKQTPEADLRQAARDAVRARRDTAEQESRVQRELRSRPGQEAGVFEAENQISGQELRAVQSEILAKRGDYAETLAREQVAREELARKVREEAALRTDVPAVARDQAAQRALQREVAIARQKIELDEGAAERIAQEVAGRNALNRAVNEEVRTLESAADVAKENLAQQKRARDVRREVRRGEDRGDISRDIVDQRRRDADIARRVGERQTRADRLQQAQDAVAERARRAQLAAFTQTELRRPKGAEAGLLEHAAFVGQKDLAATRAQMLAGDKNYIRASAAETDAKRELARAVKEEAARRYLARRGENVPKDSGEALVRAEAHRRVEEEKLAAAIRQRQLEYRKEAVRSGELGGGTRFQRLQSRFSGDTSRAPDQFPQLRQFLSQKLLTTAGYAAAGAITGGLTYGVLQTINEAEELQQTLTLLRGQLAALGRGTEFENVSREIRAIAADTGVASNEVAKFASRLIGVFGGDTERALRETRAGIELAVVTGIEFKDLLQDLVPVANAFGVSLEQIGDLAVAIREKFGIAEADTTNFLGRVAPVAKEAGLSMEQVAVIAAQSAQALGKDMGSMGDLLAKIIPGIADAQESVYAVYRSRPQTAHLVDPLIESIASGNTGQAFLQIIEHYGELDTVQRKYLVTSLAERRETATLAAILSRHGQIMGELSSGTLNAEATTGKLNSRFRSLQDTVQNAEERIKEALRQIGEAAFNSGLSDIFYDVAGAIQTVLGALGFLLGALQKLNEFTKGLGFDSGLGTQLLEFVAIAFLISKSITFLTGLRQRSKVVTDQETLSERGNASARRGTAQAAAGEAAAIAGSTSAQRSGAGVEGGVYIPGRGWTKDTRPSPPQPGRFQRARTAVGGFLGGGGGVTAAAIGITSLIELYGTIRDERSQNEERARELGEKAHGKDKEQLRKLMATDDANWKGFFGFFQEKLFGDSPAKALEAEIKRQEHEPAIKTVGNLGRAPVTAQKFVDRLNDKQLQDIQAFFNENEETKRLGGDVGLQQSGSFFNREFDSWAHGVEDVQVTRQSLKDALPKLEEKANTATGPAKDAALRGVDLINSILRGEKSMSDLAREVDDLVSASNLQAAIDLAGGPEQLIGAEFSTIQAQYEAGEISGGTFIARMRQKADDLRKQIKASNPKEREQLLTELAKKKQELNRLAEQWAQETLRTSTVFIESAGTATPKAQILRATIDSVRADPSLEGQIGQIDTLLQESVAAFEEEVDSIVDPLEQAARRAQGFKFPSFARQLNLIREIRHNEGRSATFDRVANFLEKNVDDLQREVTDTAIQTNQTVEQVLLQYVEKAETQLIGQIGALAGLGGDPRGSGAFDPLRDEIRRAFGDLQNPPEEGFADPRDQIAKYLEGIYQEQKGQLAIAAAQASGNPVAEAQQSLAGAQADYADALRKLGWNEGTQAQVDEAWAQVLEAQKGVADALGNVAKANAHWGVVLAHGDPVLENTAKVRETQLDLQQAISKGDDAAVINAQQALQELAFEAIDNQNAILQSQLSVTAATVERDPVAAAQVALDQARLTESAARGTAAENEATAQRIRSEHGLEDAIRAEGDSWISVQEALDERDPVKTAQHALERAQLAAQRAEGTAAQNEAEAARIKTQHQLEDAILNVLESQVSLAIAIAEASGNSIEAAQLAYDEARALLDTAIARGVDPEGGEIRQLRQSVVQKEAALRDTKISEGEANIQFLQQMGRITSQQAIGMYQDLLLLAGNNEKIRRDLELKIHELLQTVRQDYQFNLPANIQLPTFYEARRASQTPGGPGAYTDNREVNVTINVSNNADLAAVEAALASHLGTNRYAPIARKY